MSLSSTDALTDSGSHGESSTRDGFGVAAISGNDIWWKVSSSPLPSSGDSRLHVNINGRYITIFKHNDQLSAIDAICHHAGGPLTQGKLQDIEDLAVTVVLCPWHHFMVTIDKGLKAYQAIDFIGGKPVNTGWKLGKLVQRAHNVKETSSGIYIVSR